MRLRGGFTAPPLAARAGGARRALSAPASRASAKLSSRVSLGLVAMARGGVFGASKAMALHRASTALHGGSTQRLRGGRSLCATTASSTSSDKRDDKRVDLPVPECVTGGEEMAPQYNPAAVEEPLYKWWEASGFFKPSQYKKGEKNNVSHHHT